MDSKKKYSLPTFCKGFSASDQTAPPTSSSSSSSSQIPIGREMNCVISIMQIALQDTKSGQQNKRCARTSQMSGYDCDGYGAMSHQPQPWPVAPGTSCCLRLALLQLWPPTPSRRHPGCWSRSPAAVALRNPLWLLLPVAAAAKWPGCLRYRGWRTMYQMRGWWHLLVS